jgi:4-oxalocrotonate tautomerase
MPHVIVKLWPGKSEQQKQKLAEGVTQVVMSSLGYGEESVSVSLEEIAAGDWTEKVSKADILTGPGKLYKQPGYTHLVRQHSQAPDRFGHLIVVFAREA